MITKRFAVNEFAGDKISAAVSADLIDRNDVGMIKTRSGLSFLNEALHRMGFRSEVVGKNLQRYFPVKVRINCQINFAHSACT